MTDAIHKQAGEILDYVQGDTDAPAQPAPEQQAIANLAQMAHAFVETQLAILQAAVERKGK